MAETVGQHRLTVKAEQFGGAGVFLAGALAVPA
jgi:hypothetical protein